MNLLYRLLHISHAKQATGVVLDVECREMRWEYRLDLTWRGDDQVFGLQAAIMIA